MSRPARQPASVSTFQRAVYFLRLGRPLHLLGGFLFNGLGVSIAYYLGAEINWTIALWCQVAITATQLMTHYSNDYFDQDADAATVWFARFGPWAVLTARVVPVVRHFISIPAGTQRMPVGTFVAATLVGSGGWNAVFVLTGYWFGRRGGDALQGFVAVYSVVLGLLGALVVVGFVTRRLRARRRARPGQTLR